MATMPNTIIVYGDGVSDQEALAELDRFFEGARQDRLALLSAQSEIRRLQRENAELKEKASGRNVLEKEYESEIRRLETVNAERNATLNAAEVNREHWVKAWYAQAQEVERLHGELEATKTQPAADFGAYAWTPDGVKPIPWKQAWAVSGRDLTTYTDNGVELEDAGEEGDDACTPPVPQGNVADDFAACMRAAGTNRAGWSAIGYRYAVLRLPGLGDEPEAEDDSE